MSEFGKYRYAAVYWHHGVGGVDFSDDLHELVEDSVFQSGRGDIASAGFFELTDDGWVKASGVGEIADRIRAELESDDDKLTDGYVLVISGPVPNVAERRFFRSLDDARAAAADIPKQIDWTIETRAG